MLTPRRTAAPPVRAAAVPRAPRTPGRRGAVAVEFAVVSPLLFLLILGIIEFGRIMMLGQLASNSARAAGRVASISGNGTTDVTAMADAILKPAGIQGYTVKVLVNDVEKDASSASAGDKLEVRIAIPVRENGWLSSPVFVKGGTATGSAIMRRE